MLTESTTQHLRILLLTTLPPEAAVVRARLLTLAACCLRQEKHVRTLKMAVHAGNPGPYVHKVINKLVDRLHTAKNWLVRPAALAI